MDIAKVAAAAAVGLLLGALAVRWQHLLYRLPEHRAARISGRPLMALQTVIAALAAASAGLAFRPGHYATGPALLTSTFALILLTLSSTDLERKLLPNRLMYPAIALAAAFCWGWPDRSVPAIFGGAAFAIAVAAAVFLFSLPFGAWLRVSTPFGLGDVKLVVLIGLLLGWPAVTTALLYGVVIAGVVSVAFLARRRWRTVFSYGPCLAAGALAVMLFPDRFV